MKPTILFFLLIFALTSCSTFDRMKYGHINKVPASPQQFIGSVIQTSCHKEFAPGTVADTLIDTVVSAHAPLNVDPEIVASVLYSVPEIIPSPVMEKDVSVSTDDNTENVQQPIPRDWSLLIGILLIVGGLLALSLCIFYFPFSGISWMWIVAFEMMSLYAAWRLLGTGIMYFVARLRRNKTYKEQ